MLSSDFAVADARAQAAIAGEAARLDALQGDTNPELIPAIAALARASLPIPRSVASFPQALSVDLGVADTEASSFAIGYARHSELIELELSALESSGNGEVIARPKVTTQDKMPALIQSGVRIPYQSQAGGGLRVVRPQSLKRQYYRSRLPLKLLRTGALIYISIFDKIRSRLERGRLPPLTLIR